MLSLPCGSQVSLPVVLEQEAQERREAGLIQRVSDFETEGACATAEHPADIGNQQIEVGCADQVLHDGEAVKSELIECHDINSLERSAGIPLTLNR